MSRSSFRERLLDSSRGQILVLLRAGLCTVNDLAEATDLTDNAVRAHLMSLERDGLITRTGSQAGTRRPHVCYGLTPDAEQFFPKPYATLLTLMYESVSKRLGRRSLMDSLREMGHAVAAPHLDRLASKNREERMAEALEIVKELGGSAVVKTANGKQLIEGSNCPISALVAHHPDACQIAETMMSELLGSPVKQRCIHGPVPRCCFEIG